MTVRRTSLALFLLPVLALAAVADEATSGVAEGGKTAPFKVRAITGDEAGQTLCYVCKYQGAPQAILFLRNDDEGATALIKSIDDFVADHAEAGVRAFVVLIGEAETVDAWAARVAEEQEIGIPICTLDEETAEKTAEAYELNPDVPTTVLVARGNEVRTNLAYTCGTCAGCRAEISDAFAAAVGTP